MRTCSMAGRTSAESVVLDSGLNLEALHRVQPHVLLIGPPFITSVLLDAMRPALRQPVVERVVDVASLPDEGTVILRNVESMDARGQRDLYIWRESSAARVVTICEAPLYARVIDGEFSSDLYYRLNILTLVVNSLAAMRPTRHEIAQLAYALYEQRGRADGGDWADWFQAEGRLADEILRTGDEASA